MCSAEYRGSNEGIHYHISIKDFLEHPSRSSLQGPLEKRGSRCEPGASDGLDPNLQPLFAIF